jgi:hypothetical protein
MIKFTPYVKKNLRKEIKEKIPRSIPFFRGVFENRGKGSQ